MARPLEQAEAGDLEEVLAFAHTAVGGASCFTAAELEELRPKPPISVSDFADDYRIIQSKDNPEPGPWRTSRTPYLRAIMDALGDPLIDVVVIKKPAQVGASESTRNALLYWVKRDPGPCMVVYPTQGACRDQIEEQLKPLVKSNLVEEQTEDVNDIKLTKLVLTAMSIFVGWATSPQALASRNIRYLILDEVNKYSGWTKNEASPIALAKARTRIWGSRRKIVILSTPTTRAGQISKAYAECEDKRVYKAPCPACSSFEPLRWSRQTVVFPEREEGETNLQWAARIKQEKLARYRWPCCGYEMEERERRRVIKLGRWFSSPDAPERPESVGFDFGVLVTPFCNMNDLVAKFIKVKDVAEDLMEFVNQDLGQDFENQVSKVSKTLIEQKAKTAAESGFERLIVPTWAGLVVAGVDSQKDHFQYVIRAFGRGSRSRLIDFGRADTYEQLELLVVDARFDIEGTSSLQLPVSMVCIDARGYQKSDVYKTSKILEWSLNHPSVRPIMGARSSQAAAPVSIIKKPYEPPDGKPFKVSRWLVNTSYFKDILIGRIREKDNSHWELCEGVDQDYKTQMVAQHKIHDPRQDKHIWVKVNEGGADHYWDCETLATLAADMLNADNQQDEAALKDMRAQREMEMARARSAREQDDDREPWVDGSNWWPTN